MVQTNGLYRGLHSAMKPTNLLFNVIIKKYRDSPAVMTVMRPQPLDLDNRAMEKCLKT